jgi:hypothetical protein
LASFGETSGDDMNEHDKWLQEIRRKEEAEYQQMLNEAIQEAPLIGKDPFNLQELKKHWSFRYQKNLNSKEIDEAMKGIESDYYMAGKQFLTMKAYGEYLMEMELYR